MTTALKFISFIATAFYVFTTPASLSTLSSVTRSPSPKAPYCAPPAQPSRPGCGIRDLMFSIQSTTCVIMRAVSQFCPSHSAVGSVEVTY